MSDRILIYDTETNGLLPTLTFVTVLALRDVVTGETWRFNNKGGVDAIGTEVDTIPQGIAMLNEAAMIIGFNNVTFDNRALWKVYGDLFDPQGLVRDCMVMAFMLFADIKDKDFRLIKRGQMEGSLLGQHSLKAWGQRLGVYKGDYAQVKAKELTLLYPELDEDQINDLVWAEWNQDLEDYCVGDLDTTQATWFKITRAEWPEEATILEHRIHEMMDRVSANGFPFDMAGGALLETELRLEHTTKSQIAIDHFGQWWAPKKWLRTDKTTSYITPSTGEHQKDISPFRPRVEFGEANDRLNWGEVVVPKKDMKYKDHMKSGGDRYANCAYTPITLKDFNPNSRPQIVDRLSSVYEWVPQEFTEAGNAIVDDDVLRDLAKDVPICTDLAEIFYYKKRLGALADGPQAWMKKFNPETGCLHPRYKVGGTVTNRASHSSPNIGQVPAVSTRKIDVLNEHGEPIMIDKDGEIVKKTKKLILKGREGDHGWDCRKLFIVPPKWLLMGCDQQGIEMRALAHFMWEFDGGAYAKVVLEGDPHTINMDLWELDDRDLAKRGFYALIYGAQDYKLGITLDASLAMYPAKAKALGAWAREKLMTGIPAFGALVRSIKREARRGYVEALDHRKLFVRGQHSALNTKLQGAGATIAKKWCINFEEYMEDAGYVHGWDGDFAILAWVHDEIQTALWEENEALKINAPFFSQKAATDAGEQFGFKLPVDISTEFGYNWATTH